MHKFIEGKDITIKEAATFIATLNRMKEHHIGFCGTNEDEIDHALRTDFSDITFAASFVGAVENGKLIGLIGFDADLNDENAEIWGPFVKHTNDGEIANEMWEKLLALMPAAIKHVGLFFDVENDLVKTFAEKFQFEQKTDQMILTLSQEQFSGEQQNIQALSESHHDAFISLHNSIFPGTYYHGMEIITRLNATRKVFMLEYEGRLAGYAYVEAEPEYGDGSIEFIAVDPRYRGKGFGKQLVTTAVGWLFEFDTIDKIKLCVDANNNGGIGLYQSIGFEVKHELHYFTKKM